MAKKFDAKAKAKRQKIILAVLGVVFIGVLAWQVPAVLKMMNAKPPTAAAPPPPAPVTPGTGAPVAGTPVVAGAPAPAGALIDPDPRAPATGGQLVTFDRFESKDPFEQQAGAGNEAQAAPASTDAPAETPKPAARRSASPPAP